MTEAQQEQVPFMTREQVEDRAKAVLREHGLTTIPIDPIKLAGKEGIKVFNAKFSDETLVGMIAKRGDDITILVNQTDMPGRKRFTIAHELGHHFLHLLRDGEIVDGEKNLFRQPKDEQDQRQVSPELRREYQANWFAAALLMPEEEVRAAWADSASVKAMALHFNVSETAMVIRLTTLGLLNEQAA
jgi:Zn-dependent peptidase ImmA (M78 family)